MTQADPTFLRLDPAAEPPTLSVSGHWTLSNYLELARRVGQALDGEQKLAAVAACDIDLGALQELDTAGASQLVRLLGAQRLRAALALPDAVGLSAERRALLEAVLAAHEAAATGPQAAPARPGALYALFERIGAAVVRQGGQGLALLGFMGMTLEALARTLVRPGRWRVTAVVAQIEQVGLNAVPIVALLTFMVGAVIAFLGATVLADFGATIYTVNLVGFSFLREFAVLLTAILMAGRTASAFTAQLGSMKANEEIDAIRMLGLSPIDLLVAPRIVAMLVSLPLLTFVGMVAGIAGGALVCVVALDIPATMFFTIFQRDIELRHFVLGMVKAPVFAYLIAIIGCLEGFKVKGSAQSVGEHTTSAVVQSIFVVILLDALAALFYMEMGW